MLKILLVDDEFYFREAFKVSLDWESLGFSICGDANNGEVALEKIEKLQPDIVIVDINMPRMNGLDFITAINEKGYHTKIIIVSGYSEFNYAKKAIQLGVDNYLLKPIDEIELKNTLNSVKATIEMEQKSFLEIDYLKQQVSQNKPLLREKLLNELLFGHSILIKADVINQASYLNMDLNYQYFQVICIQIDDLKVFDWSIQDKNLWKFAIYNIVDEVLTSNYNKYLSFDNNDRICSIICSNEKDSNYNLLNSSERVKSAIVKYLNFTVTIGIGTKKTEMSEISSSYQEAIFAIKSSLVQGNNLVVSYDSIEENTGITNFFPVELRKNLIINMRLNNTDGMLKTISDIFKEFKVKNAHPEIIYAHCVELVSTCFEFTTECNQSPKIIFKNMSNPFNDIYENKSLNELENWIKTFFLYTIKNVNDNKKPKSEKLIYNIKEYINLNFHHYDFRIDDISKHFYMNYNHLCSIFKKETGITINTYISEARLLKAKEFIDNGVYSIVIISSQVGYDDPSYFSKCFKKHFGLSPTKYIENRGQETS